MPPHTVATLPLDVNRLGLSKETMPWPTAKWWQRYEDSQLNALIAQALDHNPSMTIAQARIEQAYAALVRTNGTLKFNTNAKYTLARQHYSNNYIYPPPLAGANATDNSLTLNFLYEIDFWGKNRSHLQSDLIKHQAVQAESQAARNVLVGAVLQSYIDLQHTFAQRKLLENILSQQHQILSLIQERAQAGLSTQFEIKQAESSLANIKVELTKVENQKSLLLHQISALIATDVNQVRAMTPVVWSTQLLKLPTYIPLDLLGHRPDIVAARWRAQAATKEIAAAQAAFYPNINLSAFLGIQSLGLNKLLETDSHTAGVGPAFTLPIFNSNALNANLIERRAEADLATSEYNKTLLHAISQVGNTLEAIKLLDKQKLEQSKAQEAAQGTYSIACERYKAGLGTYIDVLIAQNNVITQLSLETDLYYRAYQLDAEISNVLGGGYGIDVSSSNIESLELQPSGYQSHVPFESL